MPYPYDQNDQGLPDWARAVAPIAAGIGSAYSPYVARGVGVAANLYNMLNEIQQRNRAGSQQQGYGKGIAEIIDQLKSQDQPQQGPTIEGPPVASPPPRYNSTALDVARAMAPFEPNRAAEIAYHEANRKPEVPLPTPEQAFGVNLPEGAELQTETTMGKLTRKRAEAQIDVKEFDDAQSGHRWQVGYDHKTGNDVWSRDRGTFDRPSNIEVARTQRGGNAYLSFVDKSAKKVVSVLNLGQNEKDQEDSLKDFGAGLSLALNGQTDALPKNSAIRKINPAALQGVADAYVRTNFLSMFFRDPADPSKPQTTPPPTSGGAPRIAPKPTPRPQTAEEYKKKFGIR